jgi:hypothetical protein
MESLEDRKDIYLNACKELAEILFSSLDKEREELFNSSSFYKSNEKKLCYKCKIKLPSKEQCEKCNN